MGAAASSMDHLGEYGDSPLEQRSDGVGTTAAGTGGCFSVSQAVVRGNGPGHIFSDWPTGRLAAIRPGRLLRVDQSGQQFFLYFHGIARVASRWRNLRATLRGHAQI